MNEIFKMEIGSQIAIQLTGLTDRNLNTAGCSVQRLIITSTISISQLESNHVKTATVNPKKSEFDFNSSTLALVDVPPNMLWCVQIVTKNPKNTRRL